MSAVPAPFFNQPSVHSSSPRRRVRAEEAARQEVLASPRRPSSGSWLSTARPCIAAADLRNRTPRPPPRRRSCSCSRRNNAAARPPRPSLRVVNLSGSIAVPWGGPARRRPSATSASASNALPRRAPTRGSLSLGWAGRRSLCGGCGAASQSTSLAHLTRPSPPPMETLRVRLTLCRSGNAARSQESPAPVGQPGPLGGAGAGVQVEASWTPSPPAGCRGQLASLVRQFELDLPHGCPGVGSRRPTTSSTSAWRRCVGEIGRPRTP